MHLRELITDVNHEPPRASAEPAPAAEIVAA
jgi:hypothetical protein